MEYKKRKILFLFFILNSSCWLVTLAFEEGQIENTEVTIYNVLGERVFASVVTQSVFDIDVSGLRKGIYLMKIKNGEDIINKKIIIE